MVPLSVVEVATTSDDAEREVRSRPAAGAVGVVILIRPVALFETAETVSRSGASRVDRLAERVGSTPFFAYDRRLITSRVDLLRSVLPADGLDLSYAVKANPMPAVVQHLAGLVDAFDVASALEMKTALDTAMPASQSASQDRERPTPSSTQAVAAGVTIEMESSERSRAASIEIGEQARNSAARGRAGQSGLSGQGIWHAHGRRAPAIRH